MTPETVFYNLVGIKPESEGIKWYSVAFFEAFSKLDRLIHFTKYEGVQLATSGPALIVSNHTSMWDVAKGYRVGQQGHRIPRTYTRENLLDPTIQESEKVKVRTGQKRDLLNSTPMPFKHLIAAIPRGVEAIPVPRGGDLKDLRQFLARGHARFEAGLVVAIFSMETRNKEGKLINPMIGPELLAKNNPDVPIYPMGISGRGFSRWFLHRVRVGKPFTYNEILVDLKCAELAKQNFTVIINDRIANQLNPLEKQDWYEVQRPKVLTRRKSS